MIELDIKITVKDVEEDRGGEETLFCMLISFSDTRRTFQFFFCVCTCEREIEKLTLLMCIFLKGV